MKILVALGGNALGDTPQEQKELVKQTAKSIVDLIETGHRVMLVHGNGPQVGMIQNAFEAARGVLHQSPEMPLAECGAMSQGYIGLHLQNAMGNELARRQLKVPVATIITQTIVDPSDPSFAEPSKPIGPFYDLPTAQTISKEKGLGYVEDSGRGYRIVVPSPNPIGFVELSTIKTLIDSNTLVIASGGGGVPVIQTSEGMQPVAAVIDKDKSSARLAELVGADVFIILTAVDKVMLRFGQPDQQQLDRVSLAQAKQYMQEGHFGKGSMLPKIEAAVSFVSRSKNAQVIIASLSNAANALKGETGTVIYHG
jgi:carbamate kinase